MRGRYLIRNRKWNLAFRAMDEALGLVFPKRGNPSLPRPVRSILLSNCAHLGDVLITTSLLPVLRKAFPEARLGMLVGSWSLPGISGNPFLDRIHVADHWRGNRSPTSFRARWKQWRETSGNAVREIREIGYEVAVDVYSYFPNLIPVLWRAGVEFRIGYDSGGFGPLLTHPVPFRQRGLHESQYQAELLKLFGLPEEAFREQRMVLPATSQQAEEEVRALFPVRMEGAPYRILHMGTGGSPLRHWPEENWRVLATTLSGEGKHLLFTGLGKKEGDLVERVSAGLPLCINACDRLSFGGFLAAIRGAELLYAVETVAGHIAAAAGTPCVSMYSGIHDFRRWRPDGKDCALLMSPVPCAPCYDKRGCTGMECIRNVTPDEVIRNGERMLKRSGVAVR